MTKGRIIGVEFCHPLVLRRSMKAVKTRKGHDAEYVVAEPYTVVLWVWPANMPEPEAMPVIVPAGFLTDLASVPRWARWYAGRVGPHLEASILHDWLYVEWQTEEGHEPTDDLRRFADKAFLVAMKESGVSTLRCNVLYYAVRLFGRRTFREREVQLFEEEPRA